MTLSHQTEKRTSSHRAKNTASFGWAQVPTSGSEPLPHFTLVKSLPGKIPYKTLMYSWVDGRRMNSGAAFPNAFAAFVMLNQPSSRKVSAMSMPLWLKVLVVLMGKPMNRQFTGIPASCTARQAHLLTVLDGIRRISLAIASRAPGLLRRGPEPSGWLSGNGRDARAGYGWH